MSSLTRLNEWTSKQVADWVKRLPLSEDYSAAFIREEVDGRVLPTLTSEDLKSMGVTLLGHRVRILQAIKNASAIVKVAGIDRIRVVKGKKVYLDDGDPSHHPLWGPMHQKGTIRGTSQQWAVWYKKLDEVKADAAAWKDIFQGENDEGEEGVVDGCFQWGDFKVADNNAEPITTSNIDSMFDLTPQRILQIFQRFDRRGDGTLSIGELGQALKHQGLSRLEGKLKRIAKLVDINEDGALEVPEFAMCLTCLKMTDLLLNNSLPDVEHQLCVLDYTPEDASITPVKDLDKFFFGSRMPGSMRWIHATRADRPLMLLLSCKYHLHPLGVEDVLDAVEGFDTSTHIDRFGSHFYINLTFFFLVKSSPRVIYETGFLALFVSGAPRWDTVLSIVHGPQPFTRRCTGGRASFQCDKGVVWDVIREKIRTSYSRTRENKSDFLMHELLSTCFYELKPITLAYRSRLGWLHALLVEKKDAFPASNLAELSWISLELGELHRNIRPMRHLLRQLLEDTSISNDCKMYLQDVKETVEQVVDDIQQLRDTCKSLSQDYNRYNDVRLNDTLAILTVASAIFMPAQFLSGIYGMNFEYMPELKWEYSYLIFWIFLLGYFVAGSVIAWRRFGHMLRVAGAGNTASTEAPPKHLKKELETLQTPDAESGAMTNKRRATLLAKSRGSMPLASPSSGSLGRVNASRASLDLPV